MVHPRGSRDAASGPPNMHHVAELAGVSVATVSNVLNHPEKVAQATRDKVFQAIDQLGFTLNQTARALRSGEARTIGLVVVDLTNSLFVDVARGAQAHAQSNALTLQLASANNDLSMQDAHLAFFDSARVSGIILAPMQESDEQIGRVRRHGRPVVVVNFDSRQTDSCRVLIDNERAGYIAAKHLIDLGRTRIAFVAARDDYQPVHQRREGARKAVAEAGGTVRLIELDTVDLDPPGGADAGRRLAEMDPDERPDAVLAVTDLLAMAIINELTSAGVRVPQDVAVMGCDHNSAAWGGAIPLTSVAMQGEEMGRAAVDLLLGELRDAPGTHVHRRVLLQPHLVVRESTLGRQRVAPGTRVRADAGASPS
ncbi:LacI family DNA-binding transcriptional regulator [Leifsonia sp. NPDC080035]|uniref:LacI family DNA-binding transcriptional regulator n=1 Tax=Leifsonia sp. NPDC080035 TaxID=3143936 RepID=A0AAU7GH89_9MICO